MKRKILIGLSLSLFIILWICVYFNVTTAFDNSIYNIIHSINSSVMTNIVKGITFFGNMKTIVVFNILLVILVFIKKNTKLLLITISSIVSGVSNTLIKNIVRRARPLGLALIEENTYSFPSGHAMISVLFYGMIVYLLWKHKVKGYKLITPVLVILILLIGLSRIYLGVHFGSDILAGWSLGLGILLIEIELYKKYNKE